MNVVELLVPSFALTITTTLLHLLWFGVLIAVIAAVANACVSRCSANCRYRLHFASLIIMFLCIPVTLAVVATSHSDSTLASNRVPRIADLPRATPHVRERTILPSEELPTEAWRTAVVTDAAVRDVSTAGPPDGRAVRLEAVWIAGSYLVGALLMLLRLLLGLAGGHTINRHAQVITDSSIRQLVERQAKALGLRVSPVVAYCERVAVPAVIGVVQPMILLPVSLAMGITREQLAIVLTHELAHIRRYDHLVVVLQRVFEAVWFFHPAAWYISRRLSHERENCCDDLVVAAGVGRFSYAESLCRIAELTAGDSSQSIVGPAMVAIDVRRRSHLRKRVIRLIDGRTDPAVRLTRSGIVTVTAALALLGMAAIVMPTVGSQAQVEHEKPRQQDKAATNDGRAETHDSQSGDDAKHSAAEKQRQAWLREIIHSVETNEDLYQNLQLDLTTKYQHGIAESLSHLTMVIENGRFRLSRKTSSHDMSTESAWGGKELPRASSKGEFLTIFDGVTSRTFRRHSTTESKTSRRKQSSSSGQISDEQPSLTNLARPHMLLLESGCPKVPLSVYLKGTEAVLAHSSNHSSENGAIVVEDLGEEEFQGLQCHKIRIEQSAGGQPHNSWELWLAKERNLIPVRNLGYTYRWSKRIPVAESMVDDWKEIRPGVWFPMKAHTDRYDSQTVRDQSKQVLSWRKFYRVLSVALSPDTTTTTFTELEFPSGTRIHVIKNGARSSRIQP